MREHFLMDPEVAFLNHGSYGACPKPVFAEYQRWQALLEHQPVEFLGRRFNALMRAAREPLAQYLHTDVNSVVYVFNATAGVNIVARSVPLLPGDVVLTTDHEYGAVDRTWRFVCEKAGATYQRVTMPLPLCSNEEFVERLWSHVTPKTKLISLSHITSPTALIFPVEEICRRARAAGIFTMVDGAHAIGQLPLNMEAIGADFYTSNCHKWLCAPKGSGFLYVRPERQPMIEPLIVSWGWQSDTPSDSRFIDEQEWVGTRDPAAYLATPAAIEFFKQHQWERISMECHALGVKTRERLLELTGLPAICHENAFGQLFAIRLPACDVDLVKRRLYDEFKVEVPVYLWNTQPMLRVSIQGYNTQADLDRLVAALKYIL